MRRGFDWQYLQGSLELLQTVGKWQRRFVALEKGLARMLRQHCSPLCEPPAKAAAAADEAAALVATDPEGGAGDGGGGGGGDAAASGVAVSAGELTRLVGQLRLHALPQAHLLAELKGLLLGLSEVMTGPREMTMTGLSPKVKDQQLAAGEGGRLDTHR